MNNLHYWKDRAKIAERELQKARIDKTFGIYSRFGIESILKKWKGKEVYVIFADLDDIHKLNENYGYNVVDCKIKKAFKNIKKELKKEEYIARWYSGDEWILITKNCPARLIDVIFKEFHLQNIELTIATNHTQSFTGKLGDIVYPASKKVQSAKNQNQKNRNLGSVKNSF